MTRISEWKTAGRNIGGMLLKMVTTRRRFILEAGGLHKIERGVDK